MRVRYVLLIPTNKSLLGGGACGSRPPMAYVQRTSAFAHTECLDCDQGDHGRYEGGSWHTHCDECGEVWPCLEDGKEVSPASECWKVHPGGQWLKGDAIVLAWDGKLIPTGIFHVWGEADDISEYELATALGSSLRAMSEEVGTWRRDGEPLGTLLLLESLGVSAEDAARTTRALQRQCADCRKPITRGAAQCEDCRVLTRVFGEMT